jgi:uncharacterized membrane protein YtjA (UPF0391 family)
MLLAWTIIFGVLAALFGILGFTGDAQGWMLLAKVLFTVLVLAFSMALVVGHFVVKHVS